MAQYARPDSDIAAGSWTYSTGATLFGCIDETPYSDADYISITGATGTAEIGLSNVTDPVNSADHFLRFRARRVLTGPTLTVYLYQGSTLIATKTTTLNTSLEDFELELTAGEADAITDYTDLRLRFAGSAAASRSVIVSWAELEIPDAAGASYNDAVSLAKSTGISESGPLTMAGALSVARQAGVSEAGVGTFPAAVTISWVGGIGESLQATLAGGMSLSRLAGFDLDDVLLWEWTHIPQRALTRRAYPRYAFPVGNPAIIYLGLVLSRQAAVSAASTQSANLSLVLGMSDGLSIAGGMDVAGSVALSRIAGITESLTRELQEAFSLAKYAGVASDVIRKIGQALALSKALGLTEGLTVNLSELVTLSRLDGIAETSQLTGQEAITLAEKLYIAQVGNLTVGETISLGEIFGIDARGGYAFDGAITLGELLGLSDASALALQKIFEELIGIRLKIDAQAGVRFIDAQTAGILQDLIETGGIRRITSEPAGIELIHAEEVEI